MLPAKPWDHPPDSAALLLFGWLYLAAAAAKFWEEVFTCHGVSHSDLA